MGVFFSLGPLQDPCVQYYNRGGGVYRDPKFVLRNIWTAPYSLYIAVVAQKVKVQC